MPCPETFTSRTAAGAEGLAALLREPARAVVALDFDGTLAPIVADPERARAHPGAVPALRRLAPRLCAVAVITGRPAEVAARYAGVAGIAGLERLTVLGHYGRERWEAGTQQVRTPEPPPGVDAVRDRLPALLADLDAPAGVAIEDKGSAVAVHVRRSADPDAALAMLREPLAALAARH
ncbi:MAG: trehalose-phosphatase, partial [Streptomycetales bacterium]